MRVIQVACLAVLFVLPFSMPSAKETDVKIKLSKHVPEMKVQVRKKIPNGTSIQRARQIMESNGFKCELVENAKFGERD